MLKCSRDISYRAKDIEKTFGFLGSKKLAGIKEVLDGDKLFGTWIKYVFVKQCIMNIEATLSRHIT